MQGAVDTSSMEDNLLQEVWASKENYIMINALWKSSFGFRGITEQKAPESGKPSHWWKHTGADSGSEDGEKWQWGRESIPSRWNGLQDVMKHVKAFHSPWISVVLYCWDFVWGKWGCAVVHKGKARRVQIHLQI